jgi:outer membrane protein assembly factor BamB
MALDLGVVAGGRVFVLDALTLRAFDATTGRLRWSTPLGTSQVGLGLSAVANGLVYVVGRPESGSDSIVALDEATGAVRWQLTPPEPGRGPVRVFGPVIVDGPLAFVTTSTPTRAGIYAFDRAGQVVWSAAPSGFVSALTADPGNHILYAASFLQLSNGSRIPLLTGYAEADGALRSAVVAQVSPFVPIGSLGFQKGLVFGTQSNDHGEGGIGAFALHPDTGTRAWSGDGNDGAVVATVPVLDTDPFRALTPTAGHLYVITNTQLNALAPA